LAAASAALLSSAAANQDQDAARHDGLGGDQPGALLAAALPAAHAHPVYYVQSPSRDSHDGDKTATSVHSTPALSPMASPRHSHSSVGRDSSSSRFSGHPKRSGSKAGDKAAGRKGAPQGKGWQEIGDKAAECIVDSACENEYSAATPQGRRLRAHRRNSGQGKITIEEEERT